MIELMGTSEAARAQVRRLRDELTGLLDNSFPARAGCFRQAMTAGFCVSSAPGHSAGRVDLSVLLFPRLQLAPSSSLEAQADGIALELCLRLLRHRRPNARASACVRLGHLGRAEAIEPLQEVARGDADESVREAASAALDNLALEHLPADVFAGIDLRLVCPGSGGYAEVGRSRTDLEGRARFTGVPADICCALQMTGSGLEQRTASDGRRNAPELWAEVFCFGDDGLVRGRIGNLEVEISPVHRETQSHFDAMLRIVPLESDTAGQSGTGLLPLACLGQHLYHARPIEGAGAVAVFERLPLGRYGLICHSVTDSFRSETALSAESAAPVPGNRSPLDACLPFVVHPADRRLLATLESDHGGRVVLTVATDSPELTGARVHYGLLAETGEIELASVTGTGVCRGVRYLQQRFTPGLATALSLRVLS